MKIQRRFAPISGRIETEQVAGLTGISTERIGLIFKYKIDNDQIFLSIEKSKH